MVKVTNESFPEQDLPPGHIMAGSSYCDALAQFGLDLQAAMWAYDLERSHHVFLLFSDLVDFAGPAKITQKLFQAYESSEDFKQVDPFHVIVRSSRSGWFKDIVRVLGTEVVVMPSEPKSPLEVDIEVGSMRLTLSNKIVVTNEWVVIQPLELKKKRPTTNLSRRWKRFERNMDNLLDAA